MCFMVYVWFDVRFMELKSPESHNSIINGLHHTLLLMYVRKMLELKTCKISRKILYIGKIIEVRSTTLCHIYLM